jgi:integrase
MTAKRIRFPIHVKRGSSIVKIYRDRQPSGTYYRVVYHLGGKRHRLHFNDLERAQREAEAKASQLSRGDIDATMLKGRDRLVYGRALDAVKEFGVPLDGVALEYAEARKLLGEISHSENNGATLIDAARFYARHHGAGIKRKPVADAVAEMIEAKKNDGLSDVYLYDLRYRLGSFADAFACDLCSLTPDDVQSFFDSIELGPRSFNNFVAALKTFISFAQDHGWLSKEANLLGRIKRRKEKRSPVEIFSPQEMASLFEHAAAAAPDIAPCLALGAFAGLRSEEILRLDWSDVTRRPGFIEVAAHKAKTATRRLVPITDNLSRWLASVPRVQERVWPHSKGRFIRQLSRAARESGIRWKRNGLRHSFISYRLAELQDVNRVALEAGNSPQMIFRHYRELATPEQARSWFGIVPSPSTANVIPMASHASQ